ncbi:MAG: alpha/beta hydrolase [Burkholderiales bacterium PBB5]|nr:MAG: alpha/beta hydrolase [Burkholderiales bacterium PBB5]
MRLAANGLQIEVDIQGPPGGEPLLLVMGLGMQLTGWPDALVADLVARGFCVIRLDNRDAGLSQGFDEAGVPSLWRAAMRHTLHLPVRAPYGIADMAADALGVLDALGVASAHVCGASMGGMIAQHLAARHPQRVRSLTLMMTTSGARHLPQPRPAVQLAMLARPRSNAQADVVAHLEKLLRLIGSPAYPPDPVLLRQRLQETVQRAFRPQGTARQLLAVAADGDRSPLLGAIQAPTLVLHGLADPLVPPAAGQHLQQLIRHATLDLVPGMGHDLPSQLLPRMAQGISALAGRR